MLLAIKKTALQKASREPNYANSYNATETAWKDHISEGIIVD